MNIEVEQISKEDWRPLSEKVHLVVFSESKPADFDRIDFALIAKTETKGLMGYVTCREFDAHSLYWQYGGAFPGTKGSSLTLAGYMRFVWWTKQRYKRVSTLVDNSNIVMLKMAMKVGFRIIGVRNFGGHILLEHCMEFA